MDVNIFPYTVEFTKELVQQSEIDNLVDNIVQWENKKESLLNVNEHGFILHLLNNYVQNGGNQNMN